MGAMLKLAKLSITRAFTSAMSTLSSTTQGYSKAGADKGLNSRGGDRFHFLTIPDGMAPLDADAT